MKISITLNKNAGTLIVSDDTAKVGQVTEFTFENDDDMLDVLDHNIRQAVNGLDGVVEQYKDTKTVYISGNDKKKAAAKKKAEPAAATAPKTKVMGDDGFLQIGFLAGDLPPQTAEGPQEEDEEDNASTDDEGDTDDTD